MARRRRLEFRAIDYNVRTRKAAFMKRLAARCDNVGDCLCYRGTLDHKGYARLNLSYPASEGGPKLGRVTIHAHRLFLILKLKRPIRRGYEAGHLPECEHRTCVLHLREEHYSTNAVTNYREAA